jgi:methionine biosynthesis protein MetW
VKKLLKFLLPKKLARLGGEAIFRYKKMTGPLPYNDFGDYDDYWRKRREIGLILNRWKFASNSITEGSSVLDIGCGSGEFLQYLSSNHNSLHLFGTDFSKVSVESTRRLGHQAQHLDIATDSPDDEFDYITCFEVLEHIPDAETALKNIKSSFRKQLIISIPNIGYIGCRIRLAIFGRFPITMCVFHVKEHVRHWTPKDFSEWMKREEMQVKRIEGQYGPNFFPWRRFPSLFASGVVYFIEHQR